MTNLSYLNTKRTSHARKTNKTIPLDFDSINNGKKKEHLLEENILFADIFSE